MELSEKISAVAEENKQILADLQSQIRELKAKGGRMSGGSGDMSFKSLIASTISQNYNTIKNLAPGQPSLMEVKAMTTGGNLTGGVFQSPIDLVPLRPMWPVHFRNLISVIPTGTGAVNYPRETAPIGQGSFDRNTEGNTKNTLSYNLTMIALQLKYIAGLAKVSREMLADLPFLMQYLSVSLTEDFFQTEDELYYNALSIVATTGVTSETLSGAKVLDYITQVEQTGHTVSAMVTSPAGWGTILKTKPNNFSLPGGIQVSADGTLMIGGVPLYKSPFVPAGKILVGDFNRGAAIAQAESFNLRSTEYNGTDFDQNLISFRAEARCDLMILSPESFVLGNY